MITQSVVKVKGIKIPIPRISGYVIFYDNLGARWTSGPLHAQINKIAGCYTIKTFLDDVFIIRRMSSYQFSQSSNENESEEKIPTKNYTWELE